MVIQITERLRLAALALIGGQKAVSARVIPPGMNAPSWMPFNYGNVARHGYAGNETAYSGIQALVRSFAEAPLIVTDAEGAEIKGHWLTQTMRRPNPWRSQASLWEATVIPWFISGNAFWEVVRNKYTGRPVEFWPMRPDRVKIVPDPSRFIAGYLYNVAGQDYPLAPEDVVHFKFENPRDDYWGMSPLLPAFNRIDADNEAARATKTVLENGAVPGLAVLMERAFSNQSEADRWYQKWEQRFSGDGRGRVAALDTVKDIKSVGMNFEQMALRDLSGMQEAKILSCIGTPPIMTGAVIGLESATYSNAEQFRTLFWETGVSTLHRAAGDALETRLAADLGKDEHVRFDDSKVPALRSIRQAQQTSYLAEVSAGVRTINEYRATCGLPALPEGDVLYKPVSQQVIDALGKLTPEPVQVTPPAMPATPGPAAHVDAEADGSMPADTPPAGSAPPDAGEKHAPGCKCGGKASQTTPDASKPLKAIVREGKTVRLVSTGRKASNHTGLAAAAQHLGRIGLAKSFSDRFKAWALDEFAYQHDSVKDCLTPSKGVKAGSVKPTPSQLDEAHMAMADWTMHAADTVEVLMLDLQKAANRAAMEELGVEWSITSSAADHAKTHAYKFAQSIAKTSADDVRDVFLKARQEEWTTEGVRQALMDKFQNWTSVRADMVARTETIRSTNAATVDAYREAGITEMVWSTSSAPCEYCAALDGVVVSIGEPFFKVGDSFAPSVEDEDGSMRELSPMRLDYENVETPPLHPQCECTIVAQLAME